MLLIALLYGCAATAPAPPPVDVGGAVIKTWGFLRSTTDSLGAQAQDVLTAKQHLEALETDVETQRQAWQSAKADLEAENKELAQQVADRQAPPPDYAAQSALLRLQISQAKAKVDAANMEANKTLSVWQVQQQTYEKSIADLDAEQQKVQAAMADGQDDSLKKQQELEVKQSDLEAQAVSLKAQVEAQHAANASESVEASQNETSIHEQGKVLAQQFEEVKVDLTKVKATAAKATGLKTQLEGTQQDLAFAQEHKLHTSAECGGETEKLKAVLAAEQHKVELVAAQAHHCAALEAQRDAMKAEVASACTAQGVALA